MNRGDIFEVDFPSGRRPAVIVTRNRAIPALTSLTVAQITSTVRGLPTEVPLGKPHGVLEGCCASCDNLHTISKRSIRERRGNLGPIDLRRLDDALRIALGLD